MKKNIENIKFREERKFQKIINFKFRRQIQMMKSFFNGLKFFYENQMIKKDNMKKVNDFINLGQNRLIKRRCLKIFKAMKLDNERKQLLANELLKKLNILRGKKCLSIMKNNVILQEENKMKKGDDYYNRKLRIYFFDALKILSRKKKKIKNFLKRVYRKKLKKLFQGLKFQSRERFLRIRQDVKYKYFKTKLN